MSDAHEALSRARTPRLTTISTSGGRVSITVPAGWETVELGLDGDVVAAVEPDDGSRFRSNFVLTAGVVAGTVRDWDAGDAVQLDHEDLLVGGHPGTRRLTTHATPADESVTTETWSTAVRDGGLTFGVILTANVATLRVGELAHVVDAVAASLVVRTTEGAGA